MAIDPKSIKRRTVDGDTTEFFSPADMAKAEPELSNRRKLAAARLGAGGRIRISLTRRTSY